MMLRNLYNWCECQRMAIAMLAQLRITCTFSTIHGNTKLMLGCINFNRMPTDFGTLGGMKIKYVHVFATLSKNICKMSILT